ncbi:acylphosphatase-2 isoform X1 [Drosophila teissieri]|uniref:acylphosphatase-2 isoform X1 n=1 Tax=Drosophila teissieri TaxID=7243 RepID=UPI001CB9DE93|nr:acylphosphatase-2 isoform X1 [Drosophila teissieri]
MTSNETQTEGRRRRVTLPPSTSDKGAPSPKNSEEPKRISHTEFQKRVTSDRSDEPVLSCQFEVFGIVQGVSFRMYTLRRAQKLGVRGWCKNTNENTVKGEIQAHRHSFESMRLWLKHTGSPTSRIDKCIFSETVELTEFTFTNFSIVVD